jgi:hypothetical protein
LSLNTIWEESKKLVERDVKKESIISILQNINAFPDPETGLWKFYRDNK